MAIRLGSTPLTARRGVGSTDVVTRACTSIGRLRCPSNVNVTQVPSRVPRWPHQAVSRQEQSGGIGDLFDAFTAHVETADFIGRAKTILHRSQHSQRSLAVAFELADHIDQMLQCARACNRTILGHMTNQKILECQVS